MNYMKPSDWGVFAAICMIVGAVLTLIVRFIAGKVNNG